ncbi:FmdB family zinc ribbon protein [Actinomycetospora straminea]|uniref:Putative regulatory protein FmdB zinc ribbon domain-containing protein n=1 Tax=Actinomycetospora straminea TaxID=663607 RepID=A0ABP9EHB7_9PSEU|nr:FmdB family zinc ribbon protein [Actinomycetospora straminea]MDD7935655.1 zinc ribbon domain-containing protein [Actinomycetospora straminea]
MPLYAYRCGADGPVDVMRPMGAAPAVVPCPTCGADAAKMITAPRLALADRGKVAAIDRAEASRTEPAVVSAPPPRPVGPSRPLDPRTAALPRP